jgi:hypothetical protein
MASAEYPQNVGARVPNGISRISPTMATVIYALGRRTLVLIIVMLFKCSSTFRVL